MISIIIPAYNEAGCIGTTIARIRQLAADEKKVEIIVADGHSTDGTIAVAAAAGAQTVMSAKKGRAAQMNAGAAFASGEVLYFLHADTLPPTRFLQHIQQAIQKGYTSGCFQLRFDHQHWFLNANCWFTRFDVNHFRFGDQSLFIDAALFKKIGGFNENLVVLEDQEIIYRIKKKGRFTVLPAAVITSARKYLQNGIYKTQGIFFLIYFMYRLGCSQQRLVHTYRRLIQQDKL